MLRNLQLIIYNIHVFIYVFLCAQTYSQKHTPKVTHFEPRLPVHTSMCVCVYLPFSLSQTLNSLLPNLWVKRNRGGSEKAVGVCALDGEES